jgi:hypothetical protein
MFYDLFKWSFKAPGAVTAGHGVGFTGAQASVAGQKIAGLAFTDAVTGDDYSVLISGVGEAIAGGAITVGASLTMDAQGRAVVSAAGTDYIFGDALTATTVAGQKVEVLMRR